MSLTSYRAAPPRDKPLRALIRAGNEPESTPQGVERSGPALPEKATQGKPLGAKRYVSMLARFGKGRIVSFRGFYPAERAISQENRRPQAVATFGGHCGGFVRFHRGRRRLGRLRGRE